MRSQLAFWHTSQYTPRTLVRPGRPNSSGKKRSSLACSPGRLWRRPMMSLTTSIAMVGLRSDNWALPAARSAATCSSATRTISAR
jgi:hypothetical protein